MNCLIETALLTHGLRSIANEELAQSWHCPDAILAWVDGGELKLGPIGEYLPFRERSEELIRIDCDHLEEALQTGASGALTASSLPQAGYSYGHYLRHGRYWRPARGGALPGFACPDEYPCGTHLHLAKGYAGSSGYTGLAAAARCPHGWGALYWVPLLWGAGGLGASAFFLQ